jgi:hypothetical protein
MVRKGVVTRSELIVIDADGHIAPLPRTHSINVTQEADVVSTRW